MSITAEELISTVKVSGVSAYQSDMGKIHSASQRAASGIMKAFSGVGGALKSPLAWLAGAAGGAGLLALGGQAIKASGDYQQLAFTLDELSGSADVAKKKLDFIRQLAIPATATEEELSKAGVTLESFGLRLERVLPGVAKLMAARPDRGILEAVNLYGRLAQGDFPDIELLSGFGLNKQQFAAKGVKFDANGRMLTDAKTGLAALDAIINSKYGGILDKMAGTTNAKFATLSSMWTVTLRKLGDVLVPVVLPIVEKVSTFLSFLTSGGLLEKAATGFTKLLGGANIGDAVVRGLSFVVAYVEYLPDVFQRVGKAISGVLDWLSKAFVFTFNSVAKTVDDAFNSIGKTAQGLIDLYNNTAGRLGADKINYKFKPLEFTEIKSPMDALRGPLSPGDILFGFDKDRRRVLDRASQLYGQFGQYEKGAGAMGGMPAGAGEGDFFNGTMANVMQPIASDTGRMAQHLESIDRKMDMSRAVFGGGALGRLGITPVELAGLRTAGGGQITVNVTGVRSIEQLIQTVAQQTLLSSKRRGLL